MDWEVFYIIGKLLKRRCLKWACMTHLDIWNISYGQKKGRKSNWQFDFRPLKVENQPDLLACRWHATHCWKGRRRLQLCFRPHLNLRFACEVMVPKIARVAILAISRLPLRSLGKKAIWMWASWRGTNYTIRGRWWLPPSPGHGESCDSKLPVVHPSTKSVLTMHPYLFHCKFVLI
jgi:hypothetical protein